MSQLSVPVLFLVFNRLDVTQQVFATIRQAKPTKLYIACDGPRAHKVGEDKIVAQLRQHLLDNIDWQCEVLTLFRDKNLGCGLAVSQAITWFFEHEPMGIILEDDCLPSQSFFTFCDEMLHKYQDDKRVWHIGGYSLLKPGDLTKSSYYFSRMTLVWGWASWADRWQEFDLYMNKYPDFIRSGDLNSIFSSIRLRLWNKELFQANYKKHDTWDCQWYFTSLINNALSIVPKVSLVQNLGFGDIGSAHPDQDTTISQIKAAEMKAPYVPPLFMVINKQLDGIYFKWRTQLIFFKLLTKPLLKFDQIFLNGKLLKLYKSL